MMLRLMAVGLRASKRELVPETLCLLSFLAYSRISYALPDGPDPSVLLASLEQLAISWERPLVLRQTLQWKLVSGD